MAQPSTIPAGENRAASGFAPAAPPQWGLRVSEKLVLGFFLYALLASLLFPLSGRERLAVAVLNVASGAVILVLRRLDGRSRFLAAARDWFPCILILLAYRESGLFFIPDPTHHLDYLFQGWDARLLQHPWVLAALRLGWPWLQRYLEFCYAFCYPLVPLALGSLVLGRQWPAIAAGQKLKDDSKTIDHFWTAVLLALFCCYLLFPLFPSTPPRSLFHDLPGPVAHPFFRKTNFWILEQYGIQSSVFPSGHVAAVTATALTLRSYLPRAGLAFLTAAASIAAATVYGRYHYAADALAGATIGVAAFLFANYIHRPR